MVSEVISSCKPANKGLKDDITLKRRGGGTLLNSRPVFSLDSKCVYLNCGWGIKVFSVKTGERVRSYLTNSGNDSVTNVFLYEGQPSAITSNGVFFSWEANTAKLLLKHKLLIPHEAVVSNAFLTPKLNNPEIQDLCVLRYSHNKSEVSLSFFDPKFGEKVDHPLNNTVISDFNDQHNVSFGGPDNNKLIASISHSSLNIFSLNGATSKTGIHPGETRKWTCVRVHPADYPIAAGDNTGRVVLFRKPFKKGNKTPPLAVYHWHTLPCRDIAFTPAGSFIYTGGGENVLVKWNLENPQNRNYLPRLSGEIAFIELSNNFEYIAVGTLDNSIKIIDPLSKSVCELQELVFGVISVPGAPLFPAGLTFDPRTRAIVLNGRPGHLQFYSPFNETLIFHIDVTLQNYLTQERNKVIYNTEVTSACISSNGAWLATIESREDPLARLEQRLKFWEYNHDAKCFTLNTSVESPHNGKALTMRFRPDPTKLSMVNSNSLDYMLITTGNDARFRIWTPADIDSVYRKGVLWGCENTCFYRQMDCGPLSFSEDGTILGVGFNDTLVLWDLLELNVSASLTSPTNKKPIRFVEFGHFEGFSEVVCATESELLVWNLLTLNLSWKLALNTLILVQDIASSHFAVFTKTNEVYVFKHKSSEPLFVKKNICDRSVELLSAIFVPRVRHLSTVPTWMQDSQLFFINSNQDLFCIESKNEAAEALSVLIPEEIGPITPFGSLLAAQSVNENKPKSVKKNTGYGILGDSAITQLLKYPPHTLPSISSLFEGFFLSFCEISKKEDQTEMDVDLSDDEGVENPSSSSDDDADDDKSLKSERSTRVKASKRSKKSLDEKKGRDPATAKKLAEFFKDLDEDSDKPISLLDDDKNNSSKFLFDEVAMDI